MRHFDEIYEIAADNYGLVTAAEAKDAGVVGAELHRYVADGRLQRLGHGLYRLVRRSPAEWDQYAEAVMRVGGDAFLYGESVLAMHGLALVNPPRVTVASPRRVRRKLPEWIEVVGVVGPVARTRYDGIPSQTVAEALLACRTSVMRERLAEATDEARSKGLITRREHERLKGELS